LEAIQTPQQNHHTDAMEEESTLILLNNFFSPVLRWEAWQSQMKTIGFEWIPQTKHNPDGSMRYKV